MATLRLTNGPRAGHTIDVEGELVIGRVDADLVLDDALVSRRHAAVRPLSGGLQIEDLGSSNGTFVDGARIAGPTVLADGAQVRLGDTVIVIEVRAVDAAATRLRRVPPSETRIAPAERAPQVRAAPAAAVPLVAPAPGPGPPGIAAAGAVPVGLGEFNPPARPRGSGLASRSWVPVALSFGTVVLTAIALIVYFASR